MVVDPKLDRFTSSTGYTRPVDFKKLTFIYTAIARYANANHVQIESLQVLEIGCGFGGITLPLASLGCHVRAVDVNPESVRELKNRIRQAELGNLIVSQDDGSIFDDGRAYDVVVVSEVLEHVKHPSEFAANATRRMRSGNHLILTVPNGLGPWELANRASPRTYLARWNWLRRRLGKSPFVKGDAKHHQQFFTQNVLRELFSELSLRVVDSANSDSILTVLGPLYRNSDLLGEIDCILANLLPTWLASGWYFDLELATDGNMAAESHEDLNC